jgi:hypothetical protein
VGNPQERRFVEEAIELTNVTTTNAKIAARSTKTITANSSGIAEIVGNPATKQWSRFFNKLRGQQCAGQSPKWDNCGLKFTLFGSTETFDWYRLVALASFLFEPEN